MFEKFFKKKVVEIDESILLNELAELFRDEKYDEVIARALMILPEANKNIAHEVNLKLALSYFRKGNYGQSLPIFERIAEVKNDVGSWFNVMTSAILANEIDKGKKAFARTLEIQKANNFSQEPSFPQIRYFYACALNDIGLYDEALEQLDELKKIYMQLVITDDTFVYIRGVPFMSHTLDLARKVMKGLGVELSSSEWLKELKAAVDEDGKEVIAKYYEV